MQAHVGRWGNSLAVRLPRPLAHALGLDEGSRIDIEVEDGRIVLRPRAKPPYRLDDLVNGITPDNLPDESFDDAPVGREVL